MGLERYGREITCVAGSNLTAGWAGLEQFFSPICALHPKDIRRPRPQALRPWTESNAEVRGPHVFSRRLAQRRALAAQSTVVCGPGPSVETRILGPREMAPAPVHRLRAVLQHSLRPMVAPPPDDHAGRSRPRPDRDTELGSARSSSGVRALHSGHVSRQTALPQQADRSGQDLARSLSFGSSPDMLRRAASEAGAPPLPSIGGAPWSAAVA